MNERENTNLLFPVSSSSLTPSAQHSSFSFLIREFWELSRPSSSATAIDNGKVVFFVTTRLNILTSCPRSWLHRSGHVKWLREDEHTATEE